MSNKANKSLLTTFREIFTNKNVIFSLLITITLLVFFHFISTLSMPGIKLPDGYRQTESFANMLNLLAGGGLSRMSLFAVGVGPYITAQIIVQLLSSDLIPPMSRMAKQGERGRRKLEIITRILTVPFALVQAYAVIAMILKSGSSSESSTITIFGHSSLSELNAGEIISLLLIFTGGTYICIFIGDIITKRGVGNGITLLILSGIVGSIIPDFNYAFQSISGKIDPSSATYSLNIALSFILYIMFFVLILLAAVFINGATRKIPIQQVGQGLTFNSKDLAYLPIKLNPSGVIPVIFASSIITIPGTIAQFLPEDNAKWVLEQYFTLTSWLGMFLYVVFIILFSFFYSYVQVNPQQLSENFEKSGKFIPGIKNGEDTEKQITKVLTRINWIGAPCLAIICILPYLISKITGIPSGLSLGGTGIIIIVSGTLELWNSIKSASTTSGYNMTKTKIINAMDESSSSETARLW